MFKSIRISLPAHIQQTVDPKFLFVLFFIEIGSLVFNSFHMAASELHVYNAYNELPVIYQISSKPYSCFANINYCVYEQKQVLFLKILYLVFISIIILCYATLFTIIVRHWENLKLRSNIKITWYGAVELLVLFTLALRTLLIVILFERDNVNTDRCNQQNRLVRAENIFNYFVLSILELSYIGFDLINRQVTNVDAPNDELEYGGEAAEHLRPPVLESDHHVLRNWNR